MNTRDIVLISLFAALMASLALFPPFNISFIPVPITVQGGGCLLAGGILGAKRGSYAILLFLLLVAIGFPILSGGRGGVAVLFGPTAGYLIGFVTAAYLTGLLIELWWKRLNFIRAFIACLFGGALSMNICGLLWLSFVNQMSLIENMVASIVFIPGDLIKSAFSASIILLIKRSYPIIQPEANRAGSQS